jgi:D-alanyl-D-alanine carboxypeptidase (penicillin-binding protein 5/6)
MALLGRWVRRLLTLAVVLSAFASVVASRPAMAAPATQEPQAYILVDADSGRVLAGKNVHEPHLTASTVKLLTALTALERLPIDTTVPVSARAQSQPAMKISMLAGQVWKFNDVLHALLMQSANDAAFAIAERASGSVEQFAKDANAEAKRLGATDTTFGDPAGLDDANSYAGGTRMSAYDLSVVARNALAVPEIANTAKLLSYELTDPAGTARQFSNHNDGFLTTYPGATGLKTGFTKAASRTLVTSATRNGRTMIAVVLATWDDTGWAGYLLDQGFTTPANAPGTGETIPKVRAVTADARLAAFSGLPLALGAGAHNGKAAAPTSGTTVAPPTTTTTEPKPKDAKPKTPVGDSGGTSLAATPASSTETGSSGVTIGTIINLRNALVVMFVLLLTLFLLRRRAVRRQRARRIARQKRMAEIRRRRMIDVVDPAEVVDEVSHVRVVPTQARTRVL